jgi:hypothetical protein
MAGLCDANSRANKTMDYAGAAFHAKAAYDDIVAAAGRINVQVEPSRGRPITRRRASATPSDGVDYPRMKP